MPSINLLVSIAGHHKSAERNDQQGGKETDGLVNAVASVRRGHECNEQHQY